MRSFRLASLPLATATALVALLATAVTTTEARCSDDVFESLRARDGPLERRQQATQVSGNGMPYPPPFAVPQENQIPQAWKDRYAQAVAAGLIPKLPQSVVDPVTGLNSYPKDADLKAVCSWTVTKCDNGDIWQAPPGMAATGLDDGPSLGTEPIADMLAQEQVSTTHFLIGTAILLNPQGIAKLNSTSPRQHFGSHTWSHTLLTNHTDMQLVGDLGWAQQIIYDKTGDVPMYLRPPQGDIDARVRAIAKHVFGLQTVLWNYDANDWCLRQGTGTAQLATCLQHAPSYASVLNTEMTWTFDTSGWISLNHETTDQSARAFGRLVQALKRASPSLNYTGNVADLQGLPFSQNRLRATDAATRVDSILPTRPALNVTDPRAKAGTPGAPDVSAWVAAKSTGLTSLLPTSSSTSSSSSSSSSTSSATSVATPTTSASSSKLGASLVSAASPSQRKSTHSSSTLFLALAPTLLLIVTTAW